MLAEILAYNKSALCRNASFAFSFVSFYTSSDVLLAARGSSQFYLGVAWIFAFKQFFLTLNILWGNMPPDPPRLHRLRSL